MLLGHSGALLNLRAQENQGSMALNCKQGTKQATVNLRKWYGIAVSELPISFDGDFLTWNESGLQLKFLGISENVPLYLRR